jgi:hypothetical protein
MKRRFQLSEFREILLNLSIAFISIMVIFALFECWARYRSLAPDFIQYHEQCGSILRPNAEGVWKKEGFAHIKINSKGLRDYEYPFEKPDNTVRILILGDSFTTALQVELEQTFHKILEKLLNSHDDFPKKFEVINVSQPNYGTAEEYLRLNYDGLKYEPDLVILAFYNGNDFRNNSPELDSAVRPFFILKNGQLHLDDSYRLENQHKYAFIGYNHPLRRASRYLSTHSHFYRFVRTRLSLLSIQMQKKDNRGGKKAYQVPLDYQIFSPQVDHRWENAIEVTKSLVLEIKRTSHLHGAYFTMFSIPMGTQVHDESRKRLQDEYPELKSWKFERPERILKDFCQKNNIEFLPLLSQFRQTAERTGVPLYFDYEGHFTVEGHRLLADILFKELTTRREWLMPVTDAHVKGLTSEPSYLP